MQFTSSRDAVDRIDTDCLIVGRFEDQPLPADLSTINQASNGLIERLIEAGDLPAGLGKTLLLHAVPGVHAARVLVVGLGKAAEFNGIVFQRAVTAAGKALRQSHARSAWCGLHQLPITDRDGAWALRHAALALAHSDYVYTATKPAKDHAAPATERLCFAAQEGAERELARATAIAAGVQLCRDLGDMPANLCTPAKLAETAEAMAAAHEGLSATILEDSEMAALNMNSLLAVAQGSANRPRLIHLSWRGGKAGEAPYALVGKGVTFDTGGISLKARDLMEQMKFDMCGAASALGAMRAIAELKLPLNVDVVVAAVENMPDGNAYRPGDVITSMSGQTIEVHNTDAEGRMILADALTWTGQHIKPTAMVDIATLTGACVVALGHHASGIMTPHDDLAEELLGAGLESADRGWRLPLWEEYQSQIDTPFADMKNVGGYPAGSITAGCFLARFAKDQRWAHIDIAGSAWLYGKPESATGRPVGLLTQWLVNRAGGWSALN